VAALAMRAWRALCDAGVMVAGYLRRRMCPGFEVTGRPGGWAPGGSREPRRAIRGGVSAGGARVTAGQPMRGPSLPAGSVCTRCVRAEPPAVSQTGRR
jgi:hypothetical protein